jgi:hypothetical protein
MSARTAALEEAATRFLAARRIAVTGVSHAPQGHGSNAVYTRLRDRGWTVFAVNPNATTVEGDPCYADLGDIPGGVEAVVIGTSPERAAATVRRCVDLGIGMVWMHQGLGAGSVDEEAARTGREAGLVVVAGGCPLMFDGCSDLGHRVMRRMLRPTGGLPAHA